jgi:hypothetical protein
MNAERSQLVSHLLRDARLNREKSRIAVVECNTFVAANLHAEAVAMEEKAEKLDPEHNAPAWHVE